MFLIRFLLLISPSSVSGIEVKKAFLNLVKKPEIVLSTSAYSKSCCIFWTGFALYFFIVAWAPEDEPVINSPSINLFWCVTNKREPASTSSTKTVAVAPDVAPVINSPFIKSPYDVSSKSILSVESSLFAFVPSNKKN